MKNISDLKIVVIGGGTGLSTLLRGLKLFTSNINAIVTVADDGGSSGVLREDLNIPAPGDIRNCIVALANTEDILKRLQVKLNISLQAAQEYLRMFGKKTV